MIIVSCLMYEKDRKKREEYIKVKKVNPVKKCF